VLCLNASTGKEIWRDTYHAPAVTGPAGSHPGPRSTPSLAAGKLITFGASGILSCYDASSGRLLWRKDNPNNEVPQFFTSMSPLVDNNICYMHLGNSQNGRVVALDVSTGAEKWKWQGEGPSYSSPSIMIAGGKKLVIVITEKSLVALGADDGKQQFQVAAPVQFRFYNCVSPVIDGQVIYLTGQGSGIKAIKVEKNGNDFAVRDLWSNPSISSKWNTPILKDGFLYGFTDMKKLYCINASTGATAWIDNTVNSDFSTIVDCGTVVAGLTSPGNLIILKPDHSAYSEIVKYKVSETPVYAYPVISGNAILIKDADSITCYRIK
jgi:outer membrane protein assembly factor BamB